MRAAQVPTLSFTRQTNAEIAVKRIRFHPDAIAHRVDKPSSTALACSRLLSHALQMESSNGGKREESTRAWSVFDGIKAFPPTTSEALMAEIDAAISNIEYARSTAALCILSSAAAEESASAEERDRPAEVAVVYDKRVADEAYKAACAALANGKPDAAIKSLHLALASCPPDKTSALAKLRPLLDIASSQQQKQNKQQ